MMLKIFDYLEFAFVIGSFLLSAGVLKNVNAQSNYLIIPGTSVGLIRRDSSEAELKRIYGRVNVRSDKVSLGEGKYEMGTIIFANDPTKTVEIIWKDAARKRFPKQIHITGKKSLWKTRRGISLGTTLKELERLNGKPFVLLGFGWDYAGTIVSWKNGKLSRDLGENNQTITVRLGEETNHDVSDKELLSVSSDGEFSSVNRVMQRVNPRIYQIIVGFP